MPFVLVRLAWLALLAPLPFRDVHSRTKGMRRQTVLTASEADAPDPLCHMLEDCLLRIGKHSAQM